MTTVEELESLISRPREDENLEFKKAEHTFAMSKVYRYCVALANEGGGKLILGVTDFQPRRITGTSAVSDTTTASSQIFNKLRFRVEVEEVQHPNGRVVIFHVPSRPRGTAYQHEGAYLMRSTEELVSMSEDRLRLIFDEGKPDWLGESALDGCTDADVVRLLDTQKYFDLLGIPYPTTQGGVLERFQSEQLISRSHATWSILNLGAILFAKRIQEFGLLGRRAPRVIVYEGSGKLQTKLDQPGTMGYAVAFEGLVQFVGGLSPSNEIISNALRTESQMFPQIAIRELVANALIHQDFNETGSSVLIEIYDDRMEISNPGIPLISTDRFIDEYKSRNERMADLMRRLGICEEKSSGVDKVINAAEVLQLPPPDFRVGAHHTTAVIFAHLDFEQMDREARIRACYQHCCLKYVMNSRMTNQSLRDRFKLPAKRSETVSRILRDALDEGKIKLSDSTVKSVRYRSYIPSWA